MSATKKCPSCAEDIQADAVRCKHCNEFVGDAKSQGSLTTNQVPASNAITPQGAEGQLKWAEDVFGWVFVAAAFVGGMVGVFAGDTLFFILLFTALLGAVEGKMMKARGLAWPSGWWALVFPVYLWKRLDALRQSRRMFWMWTATALAMSLVVAPLVGPTAKPGDLLGTWAVNVDRTVELVIESKGLSGPKAEFVANGSKVAMKDMKVEFTATQMITVMPHIAPYESNYGYKVTGRGRDHLWLKDSQGNKYKAIFRSQDSLELVDKTNKGAIILDKQ